jgi:hypothetical protein
MPDDNDPERIWDELRRLFARMDGIDEAEALSSKATADAFMRRHGLSFRKIIEQIKKRGVLLPLDVDAAIQMMDPATPSEVDVAYAEASLRGARRLLKRLGLSFEHIVNAYVEFEQLHRNDKVVRDAMERLRRDHQNAVDELRRDYRVVRDTMERLRLDHQNAVDKLRRKHQAAFDELRHNHQTAFDGLRDDHQASVEKNERAFQVTVDENKRLSQEQQAVDKQAQKLEANLNQVSERVNIFIVVAAALSSIVLAVLITSRLWAHSGTPDGPVKPNPSPQPSQTSVVQFLSLSLQAACPQNQPRVIDRNRGRACSPPDGGAYQSWRFDSPTSWQRLECWRDRSIQGPCF